MAAGSCGAVSVRALNQLYSARMGQEQEIFAIRGFKEAKTAASIRGSVNQISSLGWTKRSSIVLK